MPKYSVGASASVSPLVHARSAGLPSAVRSFELMQRYAVTNAFLFPPRWSGARTQGALSAVEAARADERERGGDAVFD